MRRVFKRCPRCHANLIKSTSWNGNESEFWMECTQCNTYVNTYIPQLHQEAIHKDNHTYIGNFGGYGTGKTLTSRMETYKHCFITPNANWLIGADVVSQYEQTIKRELENDIPVQFIRDYSVQKAYMDLQNGARILYRPLADAGRIRSYNLTGFVIVEASEVPTETFSQLKTRTRNTNAAVQEKDKWGNPVFDVDERGVEIPVFAFEWRKGIVESNPDSGWIRTEVLLVADVINKHGSILDNYAQNPKERDPATSAHVATTSVNKYLPKTFIQEITKNKPAWWVSRYVLGSFSYAEGLVYPKAVDYIVPPFPIPDSWRRIISFDYGLHDNAVYIYGAIDPVDGLLYIYKEVVTNNQNVDTLAELYFENSKDIPVGGLICAPIMDPKSIAKRDYDKKTLGDHFLEKGIYFEPGFVNVDARVYRLNTYIESGKIRFFETCQNLMGELREYKFVPLTLDRKPSENKPVDKNNHSINALEWIVMRLPADPKNLVFGAYDGRGNDITGNPIAEKDDWMPWQLKDSKPADDYTGYVHYLY